MLDGTEITALLIGKRSPVLKVGDVILGFNVVLFLVAMSVLGVEPALYSILTYVAAARTLEFILHGIEEFTAITIMSAAPQPIRQAIIDEMGRTVTVYKATGGKSGEDREILYCVVTRLEIGRVRRSSRETHPRSSSSIRWPTSRGARCVEVFITERADGLVTWFTELRSAPT